MLRLEVLELTAINDEQNAEIRLLNDCLKRYGQDDQC